MQKKFAGIMKYELRIKGLIVVVFFLVIGQWSMVNVTQASHCPEKDYDCQIAEVQREIDALSPAHEYNKAELADLRVQLNSLTKRIVQISGQLEVLREDILKREEDLAYAKRIFEEKTNTHYKFLRLYDPIMPFLSSSDASGAIREISFRQKAAQEDILTMEGIADDLLQLKRDKDNLITNQNNLASAKAQVSSREEFLSGEVEKTESYLAELSSRQQEILAAKSGSFIASVGDSELADDYNASIRGFRESAPAGSFAVFSFGAYTHRKGMSQYGARGRAENGQDYGQILSAYYGKGTVGKDTSGNILVDGVSMNFEDRYLMGIAEMPSSWHPEALKAQAIAARTYAYRYKTEGRSICSTEACQVFRSSKADNPPSAWREAVQSTRGQVLEDVVTFYSSTSGGYLTTLGWDTTDGSGGTNFIDRAWENKGGSPWLYKAWYREGYSASGSTCGRGNPWLSKTELADIVNAALVLQNRDDDRITPVTTSCWGGNPYSYEELRNVAIPYGGTNSVSSVAVLQGDGTTNEVVVNGSIKISGVDFKRAFNLRAAAYLRIPQSGFAFYNIETK
jgi:predicted  nucleic acid-binding Zn-ribbon protein